MSGQHPPPPWSGLPESPTPGGPDTAGSLPALTLGIATGTLVLCSIIFFRGDIWPEDDAYIFYRYAVNLVSGEGLVYNPGERVMGFSSPLFLAWLGLLGVTQGVETIDASAVRWNFLWFALSSASLGILLWRLSGSKVLGLIGATLSISSGDMLDVATGGMESMLFSFLMLSGLWLLFDGRSRWSAGLLGAALLTRPEGLFLAAAWIAWSLWHRRLETPGLVLLLGPALVWLIFSTFYFGSPVPQTIIAKSAPMYDISLIEAFLGVSIQACKWLLSEQIFDLSPLPSYLISGAIIASLVLLPIMRRPPYDLPHLGLVGLAFAFFTFYCQPGMVFFPWYHPPVWYLLVAVMCLSAYRLLRPAGSSRTLRHTAVVSLLLVLGLRPITEESVPRESPYRQRVQAYRDASLALAGAGHADARVLAWEIGALGFHNRGPVLDAAGLVSPESVAHLPIPRSERHLGSVGAIRYALVAAAEPEFIVAMPMYIDKTLLSRDEFLQSYYLMDSIDVELADEYRPVIHIYARRSASSPRSD